MFGEDYLLFGGEREANLDHKVNVAVVSTSHPDSTKAVLISNYNRGDKANQSYRFERPQRPDEELKIWEAAAATSASPGYFKPLYNSRTYQSYMDGGISHNNPAKIAFDECRLLWPDLDARHPDILLSLATGKPKRESIKKENTA